MSQLLRFPGSVKREPAIEVWMHEHSGELGAIAQRWFKVMRDCGDDVRELLHDGHPTACVGDAAFAYVNAFKSHVNVGFFRGAEIFDPEGLLEGTGRFMRHVKLRPDCDGGTTALTELIETAYCDMKQQKWRTEIVDLLAHLFHRHFCPAENVPDDKKAYVAPAYFDDWLEAHLDLLSADELCEAAEVSPMAWEKLRELSSNGQLFSALTGIWFTIVLKDRIGPNHKLLRVVSSTLLTWEDGVLFPMQVIVTPMALQPGETFNDGLVAAIAQRSTSAFLDVLLSSGLDGIYAKARATDFRGTTKEDPLYVLLGALMQILPQLAPEYHPCLKNWIALLKQIFAPVQAPAAKIEPLKPTRGGWSQ